MLWHSDNEHFFSWGLNKYSQPDTEAGLLHYLPTCIESIYLKIASHIGFIFTIENMSKNFSKYIYI